MKKLLLIICIFTLVSFGAFSQTVYLADTAFATDIGVGGAEASCIFAGGASFGAQMNRTLDKWVADAFTVPVGETWAFDTVIVYSYQVGSGTTSTFLSCNLQLYNVVPALGGSVISGDAVTNVLTATGFTGIYRVDTEVANGALNATNRPIMYLKLFLSPAWRLSAGTYWLSWSATGSLTSTTSSPEKVLPGRINPPWQQAQQYYDGDWNYFDDNGYDIGMNMIIKASAAALASLNVTDINKPTPASLSKNIPNPFSTLTNISFHTSQAGYARVSVYNTIGQVVATLFDGETNAGAHEVTFNADKLTPGIYYYQLSTSTGTETRQMLMVR